LRGNVRADLVIKAC